MREILMIIAMLCVGAGPAESIGSYSETIIDRSDLEHLYQPVLQYGDCAESTLSAGETHVYEFVGSIGDVITVRMQDSSNPFTAAPRIRVYDPTGVLLGSASGNGTSVPALIDGVLLPLDGTYTILASDVNDNQSMAYGLHLQRTFLPGQATTLLYGDCAEGTITTRACRDSYTFTGSAGDVVTIRMQDSADPFTVAPWFRVYDPTGALLGTATGNGTSVPALIDGVVLPQDGTYAILAGISTGDGSMTYGLHVQRTFLPGQATTLLYGDCAEGTITTRACRDSYTFTGSAGDVVTIRMQDSADPFTVAPWFRVYDPTGALLGTATGNGTSVPALIDGVVLPQDGTYAILAGIKTGDGSMTYGLHVQRTFLPGQATTLLYGDCTEGTITIRACRDSYTFTGSAGDVVAVYMQDSSDPFSGTPWFRVYDPSGALLATRSGSSTGAATLNGLILPVSGTFAILAGESSGDGSITYTICLDLESQVGVPADAVARFALEPLRNPSRSGRVRLTFSLPIAAYATLELIDVTGRLITSRDVGTLGAGRHEVVVGEERPLSSGVYFVRLTQGTHRMTGRVTVLR